MHKLLFVVSDFPPLAGTNTQRIQNFVKYLPRHGWKSVVVTQAIEDMTIYDSKEAEFSPDGCKVIRVANPDIFAKNRRNKGEKPLDVRSVSEYKDDKPRQDKPGRKSPVEKLSSLLKNLTTGFLKEVFRRFYYVPDALRPWSDSVYKESLSIIANENIDVLVTSIPAYSCHIVGLKLKKGRPDIVWVADFRDLWVDRPGRVSLSKLREFRESRMERAVIKNVDRILVASPAWKERLEEKYGVLVDNKITVLTNGYDGEKLDATKASVLSSDKIIITNTGAMFSSESPVPFLLALGEANKHSELNIADIEVRLIGYAGDEHDNIIKIIEDSGLTDVVKMLGTKPHDECIAEQKAADILLLCNGMQHKETIRGKSFEYMATGNRIFALTPLDGVQADILSGAGTAVIVNHDDLNEIRRELVRLVNDVKMRSKSAPNWEYIQSFSRENLTAQLALVLNDSI